ncbi:MAG: PHP domain-containing protein [Eubacteriales bacterium]|nr:PHP domain-containing protein [Eubacteriales bacterium]
MPFLYETHLHTCQASACGRSPGHDYIKRYQDFGFEGIIVTDHFYGGNCAVDRSLPWPEWVKRFCAGYEDAAEEGQKQGFQVFFGWEQCYDGDEYLVYGLDKAWLLAHPECVRMTRGEQYAAVHAAGGCVVQAHPFRQRSYLSKIHLSTGCVDGVEAFNSCNEQEWDAQALRYANQLKLPITAGSDIHQIYQMPKEEIMGVSFDHKLQSVQEYAAAIRHCEPYKVNAPKERGQWTGRESVILPVDIRDKHDRTVSRSLKDFWVDE